MQGGLSSLVVACRSPRCRWARGCIDRDSRPAAARDDPRRRGASSRSALIRRQATWPNLWGSWPQARYSHAMAYDSDRKVMVMYGGQAAVARPVLQRHLGVGRRARSWNQRANTGSRRRHALRPRAGLRPGHEEESSCSAAGSRAPASTSPTSGSGTVGSAWVTRADVSAAADGAPRPRDGLRPGSPAHRPVRRLRRNRRSAATTSGSGTARPAPGRTARPPGGDEADARATVTRWPTTASARR